MANLRDEKPDFALEANQAGEEEEEATLGGRAIPNRVLESIEASLAFSNDSGIETSLLEQRYLEDAKKRKKEETDSAEGSLGENLEDKEQEMVALEAEMVSLYVLRTTT